MRRSVAPTSFTAAVVLVLSACSGTSIELVANEAYCFAGGEDPGVPEYTSCANTNGILIYRDTGEIQKLDLSEATGFITAATLDGNTLTEVGNLDFDEGTNRLRRIGEHIRVRQGNDEYETLWLIPAKSRMGSKVKKFDRELRDFDPTLTPPEGQAAFIDVPLCYDEQQYHNGRETRRVNSCPDHAVFFTSTNQIINVKLDTLGDAEGPEWHVEGEWQRPGGIARLGDQKGLDWSSDATGAPTAKRQLIKQQITGFQQRRDPNVREIEISYLPYVAANKDEAMRVYATRVYPQIRRQLIIEKYFADH